MKLSLKDDFLEALNSVKRDIFNGSDDTDPADNNDNIISANAQQTDTEAKQPQSPASDAKSNIYDNIYGDFSEETQDPVETIVEPAKDTPIDEDQIFTQSDDGEVLDAFRQASSVDSDAYNVSENQDGIESNLSVDDTLSPPVSPPSPFRSFDSEISEATGIDNNSYNLVDDGGASVFSDASSESASPAPVVSDYSSGGRMYEFDRTDLYSDDKTIISKNTVIRGALQTDDSIRLLGQVLGDIDCKSNIVVAGKVRGNTTAANAYIMDAQVDGSLQCDDVVSVSSDAWVLGDIRAQQAEIDGKVKGNLDIRHAVSVGSTSSIIGNISTDELEIKRGAFINGQIMMYTPSRDVLDKFDHFEK